MNTFTAIENRRAVKHFDPDHRLSDAELERLLGAATSAPTAYNIQNWRFVVVHDRELRRKLRHAAFDQAQVTEASLLVVLCADLNAWERRPERYWSHAPHEVREILVPMIDDYYRGRQQTQRDEAMRSCGMAAQNLMLCAKAMGYDSCPMNGFDFEQVATLIDLPDDHVISMFIVIGKALEVASRQPAKLPLDEVVVFDRFRSAAVRNRFSDSGATLTLPR